MNAEKQYKKSSSNLVQSKQCGRLGLVDNRPETLTQAKLIRNINNSNKNLSIQKKNNIMQFAPWNNINKTFRSDNGTATVPKTIYKVLDKEYLRYAPINTLRAPGQEFHEGNRTFAYLGNRYNINELQNAFRIEKKEDEILIYYSDDKPPYIANYIPAEGLDVWDAETGDDGSINSPIHVGHPVCDLDCDAGVLNDADKLQKLRKRHNDILKAQETKKIAKDSDINEELNLFCIRNGYLIHRGGYYECDYDKALPKWKGNTVNKIREIQSETPLEQPNASNLPPLLGLTNAVKRLNAVKRPNVVKRLNVIKQPHIPRLHYAPRPK